MQIGAESFSFSYFGAGVGPIYLDNVQCLGTESILLACPSNPLGDHNCGHFADAGVRCPGLLVWHTCMPNVHPTFASYCFCFTGPCADSEVRLEGAKYDNEGRVQICFNDTWGTVCDSNWGTTESTVVCNQLGFSTQGQ